MQVYYKYYNNELKIQFSKNNYTQSITKYLKKDQKTNFALCCQSGSY